MLFRNLRAQTALAIASLAVTVTGWALPSDREQPINIQADAAEQVMQEGRETTVYTGSVIMTQGSMLIEGDEVTIFSKERTVTKIVAVGKPAHFKQQSEQEQPPVKAYAQRINYDLNGETIVLFDEASLLQGGDTISGKRIDYNIATEQVKAASTNDTRVNIVLEPKKNP